MTLKSKIRLFVDSPLGQGQSVSLNREQSHYLCTVMRLSEGAQIYVFNGADGEWLGDITALNKRSGVVSCVEQTAAQKDPPDLWLLFAPIKKTRTDFIVEKATELGVAKILPVRTDFTNSERIKKERLQAHAIEAAEQCRGTFVPNVESLEKLETILANWPDDRMLLFCDENCAGDTTLALADLPRGKWAIIVGPEGGFSKSELLRLRKMSNVVSISLGPRILRADTAAVAAITLWQSQLGDWR